MKIVALFLLLLLGLVGPALAGDGEDRIFMERPGVLEFSGQMIARPLQADALEALGLDPATIDSRRAAAALRLDPMLKRYVSLTDEHIIVVPEGHDENSLAAVLMATGDYQYVEPDWICYPIRVPNDPYYGQQWHHTNMQSALAWDLFTGAASQVAAVCDTGVDKDHPDLQAHLIPGYNAVDRLPEVMGGDVSDINGHGTATTGCVGAIGNNGTGVAGINWTISLMPIRVSNSSGGGANMSDLTHGSLWAAQNGAKTVSVSYTGVESSSVGTTGTQIKALDALLIWAADNYNQNHSSFDWQDVIVVGATDQSDNKASFSSYGLAIDVMAPGVDIMTTALGGGYNDVSGTSFSTPLTNGACALIWSFAPGMSANDVEQTLFDGCDDMGNPNHYGFGRVNVYESLRRTTLAITFPNGLPEGYRPPGLEQVIELRIVPGSENYVPGTGFMYYRFDSGSSYIPVPVTPLGGDDYEVEIPATVPGDHPEFYFVAKGDGGSTVYSPPGAPNDVYSYDVYLVEEIFVDNFESDEGWTVLNENVDTGAWERAVPAGSGGTRGDPPQDSDGSGKCYVTGNGNDEDLDGGPTRLISPVFDLSSGDAQISYYRWQYNDDGDDYLVVEISNNAGGTWVQVESVSGAGGWSHHSFNVSDFVSPTSQIQVRFVSSDNPNNSVTESGLDDFRIQRIHDPASLWAEAYSCSAALGSDIPLLLDAGAGYVGRTYKLVGSFSGSRPGTILPGGLVLPLNRDFLTDYILYHPNLPVFAGFNGNLDAQGGATAHLRLPSGAATPYVGQTMTYAFTMIGPFDFVSNPIFIQVDP